MKRLNIVRFSAISLTISGLLMAASIAAVAIFGLNLGIDFTGGSIMDVHIADASTESVSESVIEAGFEPRVQTSEEDHYLIRLPEITEQQHQQILAALATDFSNVEESRFDVVGPVVGGELKTASIRAVIILLVLIALYISWAFRRVSLPVASWKYGIVALLTAFHDVVIPLGVFAILGHFWGFQVDTAFVAALLTILGYSINDTIVVLDRTRENLFRNRHTNLPFAEIVNQSVFETLGRSLNTTLTTLLPLFAILILGGDTTRSFVLALIIGIMAGAYSSIFLASPVLVLWEKYSKK